MVTEVAPAPAPTDDTEAGHILVVDDDPGIRDVVSEFLNRHGFSVDTAADGREMERAIGRQRPDLVVLDLMLPGEDGLSVCRRLRGAGDTTPVIMLTAKGEDVDRIVGLEMGADDYLPKPFAFGELVARIRALARRPNVVTPPLLHVHDLVVDPTMRTATRAGQRLTLSRKEFAVLETLLAARGAVISAETLLERVWDEHADPFTGTVRMTIMKLRRKLGEPAIIETITGEGYRIES